VRTLLSIVTVLTAVSCTTEPDSGPYSSPEPGEWLPGGDTTNTLLLGSNAFLREATNLSFEELKMHFGGNGFFNMGWVAGVASTDARDGLGPFFNARSCSGCHTKDGRAKPPEDGDGPFGGLLLRLSVPGPDGPMPDPIYGSQLQDRASYGVKPEAIPVVKWIEEFGSYPDGTEYSLVHPTFTFKELAYGPMPEDVMISPRIGPHMVGLGLLEAIPLERLQEIADPDDEDGDGVSGRIQWHQTADGPLPGRFGWKGDSPTVETQVAGAFKADMGLTSWIHPEDDCTEAQVVCLDEPNAGEPEVTDHILGRVTFYCRTIAVPVRRNAADPDVLHGKKLFNESGCATCHTPSHVTGDSPVDALKNQLIWPYTDLLLHDMGPGLADGRPVAEASGQEWKTPPLWSLGLIPVVSKHTRYLHDGRARNLEEAILWHGGEAEAATLAFMNLTKAEREHVLKFIADL